MDAMSFLTSLLRPKSYSPPPGVFPIGPPLTPDDRDVLIRTIWGEARGEPEAGQIAVIHVIRNRAIKRGTSAAVECKRPAQFSCWWDAQRPRLDSLRERDPAKYKLIGETVDRAWAMADTVKGARHYYAPAGMVPPGRVPVWARGKTPAVTIGGHLFFNEVA
jgi:N-acetylmuramoyl-L-alanine amidase